VIPVDLWPVFATVIKPVFSLTVICLDFSLLNFPNMPEKRKFVMRN